MGYLLEYSSSYINGTKITILISLISLILGLMVGLIACLGKMSKVKVLKAIASIYIEVIRDTPLLVQVMLVAYGLPQLGVRFPSIFGLGGEFTAGVMVLSLNSGAYVAEILRSGIQAVDKGQMEASRSLGLSHRDAMRYVIVPQAVKNILPALANEFISLVKESAIISLVAVTDLMFVATAVRNSTYKPFGPYLVAAAIYFVITFGLSKLVGLLEKKMSTDKR